MTEAEKLLAELQDEEIHEAYTETDMTCVIDNDLRTISIPAGIKILGVEGDEDVHKIHFRMPRMYGEFDLFKFVVRIVFKNANNEKDQYIVTDAETDDSFIRFSWLASRKVTKYKGNTEFIACLRLIDDSGTVIKEFNTTLAKLPVLEGLEPDEMQADEEVQDVVTQLLRIVNDAKKDIETSVNNANVANMQLQDTVNDAGKTQDDLSQVITQANTAKANLDNSVDAANVAIQSLGSENSAAVSNIADLRSENFNSQEILIGVADLRAYLGLSGEDVLGLQVDYKNGITTRIAGADSLTAGADFDKFSMFGGRRRCTVADDGTITSWYGDANYTEDGSIGQVMVYQPKFYYLVYPVSIEPIDTGIGYHLRKANYYVSEHPRAGFKLHPAFYDANGNEIDYYLTSAYEGSIWDADGGDGSGAYLMNDEQVMNTATDKFCSIAGVKPTSGLTQNLTRANVEQMAKNRGESWHSDLIKQVSAEQMLMIIEMGTMKLQTAIAKGVVDIPYNDSYNSSSLTGSTSNLGNGTGQAAQTINEMGGTTTTETANGMTAICWRGKENFWGNIQKSVYGVNFWGNGAMGGGQPYICTDFNFAENKNSGNYEGAGFTMENEGGYISAMGYSTKYDWLFIASECLGDYSLPVGDIVWWIPSINDYRIALLGGGCDYGTDVGAFCWLLDRFVGDHDRSIGGRLVFIPTKDSVTYNAAIASWKAQMQNV